MPGFRYGLIKSTLRKNPPTPLLPIGNSANLRIGLRSASRRFGWTGRANWGDRCDGGDFLARAAMTIERRKQSSDEPVAFVDIPFQGIVEQSLAGVYIVLNECFIYANETFAGMFGYSPSSSGKVLPASHPVKQIASGRQGKNDRP